MTLTVVMPPACALWMPASRTLIAVEHAHVGLDRRAAVGARDLPDVAVRVDEAGHQDLARDVVHRRPRRDRDAGADRDDLAAVDEEGAVLDLAAGDREDARAGEGVRVLLRHQGGGKEHGSGGPGCNSHVLPFRKSFAGRDASAIAERGRSRRFARCLVRRPGRRILSAGGAFGTGYWRRGTLPS